MSKKSNSIHLMIAIVPQEFPPMAALPLTPLMLEEDGGLKMHSMQVGTGVEDQIVGNYFISVLISKELFL